MKSQQQQKRKEKEPNECERKRRKKAKKRLTSLKLRYKHECRCHCMLMVTTRPSTPLAIRRDGVFRAVYGFHLVPLPFLCLCAINHFCFVFGVVFVCVLSCARAFVARVPIRRLPSAALQSSPTGPERLTTNDKHNNRAVPGPVNEHEQSGLTRRRRTQKETTATSWISGQSRPQRRTGGHWGSEQRKGEKEWSPKPPLRFARFKHA